MPFVKPMTGLKFFVNTTKPMPKFRPYIYDKILKFKTNPMLRPFVNTGPGILVQFSIIYNYNWSLRIVQGTPLYSTGASYSHLAPGSGISFCHFTIALQRNIS